MRARFPLLLLPTVTFRWWFGGLIGAVAILLTLSPAAARGEPWMRPVAYAFGIVMAANGGAHLAASIYKRKTMPGMYSAPLILAAAVYLLALI